MTSLNVKRENLNTINEIRAKLSELLTTWDNNPGNAEREHYNALTDIELELLEIADDIYKR